ncbi:phage minor capsid protein [Paenibacillus sp. ACRRY]|uniref:phage minor capsid protein n=1 Tax=Paenibacillus sp. ACRRY TaxID=2918208 RepID=UPI001EF654B5|nr:phage minor capsid protein [Paenibacillus sp. ACRRY]MCG7383394.1 phage minor capsid protein [Paenibacillus sp. ACRRY]
MARIPDPNYDRDINRLVDAYKRGILAIATELSRLDVSDISRAHAKAALAEIAAILRDINAESAAWVAEYVPKAATDGVARAIVGLGVANTLAEAEKIVKFNRINREMVASAIADTQADLLAVTQNIDRRVRQAVRQATAESFRANMASGINGRRTINADTLAGIRKTLGQATDTGIIDAAGRRWKPEVYVDTVTRTKLNSAHRDATINEAIGRETYYAQISSHGARDACRNWEGRIVKLVPDAPGDYPYVGDLPRREIFHPRCRHVLSPVRSPENIRGGI